MPLVASRERSVAFDVNATYRPDALKLGRPLLPLAACPTEVELTSCCGELAIFITVGSGVGTAGRWAENPANCRILAIPAATAMVEANNDAASISRGLIRRFDGGTAGLFPVPWHRLPL
jgi:hypothetical protein